MEVSIRGWKTRNLRGGLTDLELDFGETPSRWTLIQMPNGMGKTTTMDLLRTVLTDVQLTPSAVKDLRANDEVERGSFEVRLLVGGKPYRVGIDLDFRDGSASRYTVRAAARDGGHVPGRVLPQALNELLTPDLARMFVFNGELAKEIRDMERQTADDAIKALYRLDQVTGLKATVDQLVDMEQRRAAALTSAKEDKGIVRLTNAYQEAVDAKRRLEKESRSTAASLGNARTRLTDLTRARDDVINEDESLRARLVEIKERQALLIADTQRCTRDALLSLRRPPHVNPRLLERLHYLGDRLFDLKLPETISSEFFRDLAAKDLCVCGRPLGHAERHYITTKSSQFLAQDQISVINQMKHALRESAGDPSELSANIDQLRERLSERQRLRTDLERLELERGESGDDTLEKFREQIEETKKLISQLEAQLERLTTKDTIRQKVLRLDMHSNLAMCEVELTARQDRLAAATNTRRFKAKADSMNELLRRFGTKALGRLRERVRVRTNEKLREIARTELLEIRRIDGGLQIVSPGLSVKTGVSEGQSLSVAYAFLTSLLSDAPYRLPFIVDSPVGSLDKVSRRKVSEIIPNFFHQMIMFVISTEREGFVEAFYGRSENVRYLTVSYADSGQVSVREGQSVFSTFQDVDEVP